MSATGVMIIGESGTGKSTSIDGLNPQETVIINVQGKSLPFKGWRKNYTNLEKDKGNYVSTDSTANILKLLGHISDSRPEIKNVIVDDSQYIMANEFMRRARETGFNKFTEIGQNAWSIANKLKSMRDDMVVFFMSHSEDVTDASGSRKTKAKTIGKLLDEKISLEGMFTMVLYTDVEIQEDDTLKYSFVTQNNGHNTGKTPKGMFKDLKIPNNLQLVRDAIDEYYG
jgi:hypothetical protein